MPVHLTPELWRRVKTIAGGALDRPNDTRDEYVSASCDGDQWLENEVLSLLRSTDLAARFLEGPAGFIPPPSLQAGVRIGGWQLVQPLGHGGMGSVHLAERVEGGFQQKAALKLIRGGFADGVVLQRFRDERQILASLEHPNIARLIDGGTTADGVPFVALEYVEGVPIDVYCDAHDLDLKGRLELFRQVCAAVQYAHQRLIVHRDIKPSNILVSTDGRPKLLDFGIAKLIDPAGERDRTHTMWRVATPENASPEQLKGETITTATDVYGLGILLYRLVTGVSPYRLASDTDAELMRAVCEQPPEPPSKALRRLPPTAISSRVSTIAPDLDHIVLKALRKEPERRYGTAEELSEDVRRFVSGLPVQAMPDSRWYRVRKLVARHRGAAVAATIVLVVITVGVAATAWQARVAARERNRAQLQFDAVRSLAKTVIWEVQAEISKLPGSLAAQQLLLTRATEYLDKLAVEAGHDLELRRELAGGYRRLGQIQGASGVPNLGDVKSSERTYRKAAALLEGIPAEKLTDTDRADLASNYLKLAGQNAADAPQRADWLHKARLLLDSAKVPTDISVLRTTQLLWYEMASDQRAANNNEEAKASYTKMLRAAETAFKVQPDNLNDSRNLSLANKYLGAIFHSEGAHDQALPFYERALALDEERVRRNPRGLWKIDLSFSHGSVGSLYASRGDVRKAIDSYERAVALREEVVRADADDDFAQVTLARGYDRLASLYGQLPDVSTSIEYSTRRIAVHRARLKAHPERDAVWRDYASVAAGAIRTSLDSVESPKVTRVDAATRQRIQGMLDDLLAVRKQWRAEKRAGTLEPSDSELQSLARRIDKRK